VLEGDIDANEININESFAFGDSELRDTGPSSNYASRRVIVVTVCLSEKITENSESY